MVVEAASASDIGDRILGVTQEFGSGAEACLQDELVGSKPVDPFDETGKARGVQAGDVGKAGGCQRLFIVRLEIFHGLGKAGWYEFTLPRSPQVT
jgi:hypothetical protein